MRVQWHVLALALGAALRAQSPMPVQGVGTGAARPAFVNAIGSGTMQNGVKPPVMRQQGPLKPITFEEYKAARARAETRATSVDEASAWVRQYSPQNTDSTTVDGVPRFSATVTLRQIHGDAGTSENVTPRFTATFLRNLTFLTNLVPGGGSHGRK